MRKTNKSPSSEPTAPSSRNSFSSAPKSSPNPYLPVVVLFFDVGCHSVLHLAITLNPPQVVNEYAPTPRPPMDRVSPPHADLIKLMNGCAKTILPSHFREGLVHRVISTGGSGKHTPRSGSHALRTPHFFSQGHGVSRHNRGCRPLGHRNCGVNSVLGECAVQRGENDYRRGSYISFAIDKSSPFSFSERKNKVAIAIFGVTRLCVDAIRQHLEEKYLGQLETPIFHVTRIIGGSCRD